jgi:hypothetical protein
MAQGTYTIHITPEQIERATQRDSRHCMIAEAIRQQYPTAQKILVDLQTIRWSDVRRGKRYVFLTPERAARALVAFDHGDDIEPFSFAMRPMQITPTVKYKRGIDGQLEFLADGVTPKSDRRRGRKRLSADGRTVRGGKPPATAPLANADYSALSNVKLSRGTYRQYGRRLLRD